MFGFFDKKPSSMTPGKSEEENSKATAIQFKLAGNIAYQNNNFVQAAQEYSNAIALDQSEPVFYLNRAKCNKQLGNFQNVLEDSKQALNLDETYVKAFLTLGEGYIEMAKKDSSEALKLAEKGLHAIRKAKSLCAG